ncbi:MAG: FlgD immunoglobulin-like domain containing protein, partial [Candidatus Eisenbacteria bacterium]
AFTVPEGAGRVNLTVHYVTGRVVRTLVDEELPAGPALAVWDGTDDHGRPLASGIYFARLASNEESAFRKMTLLN